MSTLTETRYSRRIQIESAQLEVGDQIDNAIPGREPVWDTIDHFGTHAEDEANEDRDEDDPDYCWGDCTSVIFFEAEDCAYPLHVHSGNGDSVYARLTAGGAA